VVIQLAREIARSDPMITIRIRSALWFASGVAIALLTVAVFVGTRARAGVDVNETTFVPISPCRLFDTRPGDDNVGPRSNPIGPKESHVQQVTGSNGACVIPSDATGVALNVTAVSPSASSFLTLYPANVAVPKASNLNFVAGGNAAPNKVDVKLSPSGTIGVYNLAGTVHVLADVVGYYTPKGLADLQAQINSKASTSGVYTKAEVDALLAAKVTKPTGSSTMVVPASRFTIARDSGEDLGFEPLYGTWRPNGSVGTTRCLVSNVELPAGATITGVSAGFYVDIGGVATVQLLSVSRLSASDATVHATVTGNAPGGASQFDAPSVSTPLVQAARSYTLYACLSAAGVDLEYASVTFTYPL
jgi:hypothetical protein